MFCFSIQFLYDAEGKPVHWIIVTDGNHLTHEWMQQHGCSAILLKSPNGKITPTVIKNALILINRY